MLECSTVATFDELKQAYHKKVLEYHPDKNKNSLEFINTFHKVKEAWKILGNQEYRKEYDNKLKEIEIENEKAIIFARLFPSDLEKTEDTNIFSYPCRCGNKYLVHKSDLQDVNCVFHVPCQDCTFVIVVET